MAAIDDLIAQIEDEALRNRLREEVKRLTKEKKFGLVFEEHLPELTPVYSAVIRQGSLVARRDAPLTNTWRVLNINGETAHCYSPANGEQMETALADLVVVRRFGEPIFPALTPVDRVQNGPADAPWHTLIEADNYHALQLLEYMYAGQVDCIYIDPPYNTGARDWKYNNDYVDNNDRWRHSKWLAMMKRRLVLAKRLLKRDGVLIVTIDDNEAQNLGCLLSETFSEYNIFIVVIEHNKRGRQGEEFAKTHEYAYFVVPDIENAIGEEPTKVVIGGEIRNLRRTGNNSLRAARPNQFYPIWVNPDTLEIVEVGEPLPVDMPRDGFAKNGLTPVWPIDKKGIERNWHYGPGRTSDELEKGKVFVQRQNYGIQIYYTLREKTSKRYKTVWSKPTLDASTYGSELVRDVLGGVSGFSFPKSLYAERDCIATVCLHRKNALVLDFFAGSGTTLHAVNLLNIADGGCRRCILVTNNEVSEDEAKNLFKQGFHPGDVGWEKQGICQLVTWPRSKYSILGKRDDGTELEGEYFTGEMVSKEKNRTFRLLSFVDPETLTTAARKKEVAGLIEGIPMSHIKAGDAFYVPDDESNTAAILFDASQAEAFLDALEEAQHVTHFYIITRSNKLFQDLKAKINDMLGPIEVQEEEKRPMREGFLANLEYFKLDFLEKDQVALGGQFRAILPILWLRAGGLGPRPELPEDEPLPPMLLPELNPFAVLLDETRFAEFQGALAKREGIEYVFLVTDSEEAFQEMAAQVNAPHVIQLYRDYLENFAINRGESA